MSSQCGCCFQIMAGVMSDCESVYLLLKNELDQTILLLSTGSTMRRGRRHSMYKRNPQWNPSCRSFVQCCGGTIPNLLAVYEGAIVGSIKEATKEAIQGLQSTRTYFMTRHQGAPREERKRQNRGAINLASTR